MTNLAEQVKNDITALRTAAPGLKHLATRLEKSLGDLLKHVESEIPEVEHDVEGVAEAVSEAEGDVKSAGDATKSSGPSPTPAVTTPSSTTPPASTAIGTSATGSAAKQ